MKSATGRIRIIGGSLRNSRLLVPDVPGLRPTPERVRETLFNWLAPELQGMCCLDLCAGTGALGIEALSRGAASVQFVEPDRAAALALRANLQRLGHAAAPLACMDALQFLLGAPVAFDLVLLDPPFDAQLWQPLAQALEPSWLAPSALIHVESPRDAAPALPACWSVQREASAGNVRHVLYRRTLGLPLS